MNMFKQLYKSAFTLAEILIIFFIIGTIATLTISNGNSKVNDIANSSFTYATFNAILMSVTEYKLANPSATFDAPATVCTAINETVNTIPIKNTSNSFVSNCNSSNLAITSPNKNTTPSLILANGSRIYIAGTTGSGEAKKTVIKVDIDGNKKRDTSESSGDLVEFQVTKSGVVLPSGTNALKAEYLSGNFGYFDTNTNIFTYVKREIPYKNALCESGSYVDSTYCSGISKNSSCTATQICEVELNKPRYLR